jgi:lysophospholipase L1-like esterase
MAKESMPFELKRPNVNTPVTNTSEIDHGIKPLDEVLDNDIPALLNLISQDGLRIVDGEGNAIAEISNGHLRVKNFDTRNATVLRLQETSSVPFAIVDGNGNILASFSRGFDTSKVVEKIRLNGKDYIPDAKGLLNLGTVAGEGSGEFNAIKPLYGLKMLSIGDSITSKRNRATNSWTDYLSEVTGAETINVGIGGTRLYPRDRYRETMSEMQAWARCDMLNVVKAIVSGVGSSNFDNFAEGIAYLNDGDVPDPEDANVSSTTGERNNAYLNAQNLNLNDIDIVTIFGGTNDWMGGMPSYGYSTEAIIAAVNEMAALLLSVNPNLRIFFFTPIPRYVKNIVDDEHWSSNYKNKWDVTLNELAVAMASPNAIQVPVFNSYRYAGIKESNFFEFFRPTDCTHPMLALDRIANIFASFIISQYYNKSN